MRSKRILGFLTLAFIVSLVYSYLQMPQQERVTTGEQRSRLKQPQGQKVAVAGKDSYPRLRSDLLDRKPRPYPGVRRNLFSAAVTNGPDNEEPEVLPQDLPEVLAPPVVDVTPPPPPPPSPQEIARQELARYKFVGFFKKGEKKTIFLATDGGEILLVRKGEHLGRDRKYYVVNITDTTLALRKEGAGDFSIKLTDQESLSAIPLRSGPAVAPVNSHEQERLLPEPPEFHPVPDDEPLPAGQLKTEEDNS